MKHPFRAVLVLLSLAYFFFMVLGQFRSGLAYRMLPGPILFFTQIAGLFTSAKKDDVDFRAEGWSCEKGRFQEIDIRPFFPIQFENKENRFQRTLYFYRHHQKVIESLDQYLTQNYNRTYALLGKPEQLGELEKPGKMERIGGIRFVAARTPIPNPEAKILRYHRRSLSEYPLDQIKPLYESSPLEIWGNCHESDSITMRKDQS